MAYIAVFIIGVVVGWIIFERPQWATDAKNWFAAKISGLLGRG